MDALNAERSFGSWCCAVARRMAYRRQSTRWPNESPCLSLLESIQNWLITSFPTGISVVLAFSYSVFRRLFGIFAN
jgi:hypothetical protein